jgi:ATP-dependent Clp protease adaptor protein ClpS
MNNNQDLFEQNEQENVKDKVKPPDMYRVILLNDHYTSMEFVVEVLMEIFHKETMEATSIMMDVHNKGKGIVGIYTYDIARTKIEQVKQAAKANNFPLKCDMEQV